ncbi:arginase family protein [Myxococcus stipitatus]|uniref:arginase family protein n=1 Tax=Myxococcus stipitatus TaxID=83455 RepID=UPI001F38A656|nr:arginase family protein [Myxococcus stipitatus]MCE9669888.1 arginase family protein [Myxococcus stipitatus]
MIHAYFGMAPKLTFIPPRIGGVMTMGKLEKYLRAMETLCGFEFAAKYSAGATPGPSNSFKYADFGNVCFKKEVRGACNGEVNFANFAEAFLGVNGLFSGAPYQEEDSKPFLFGVIDHNSAHHMSWPLVARAMQRATKEHALVLNFDAHYDYGTPGNESIHCSTWAVKLFELCGTLVPQRLATAYSAIGVLRNRDARPSSGDFSTMVVTDKGQDKTHAHITAGTNTHEGANVEDLLAAIEAKAGLTNTAYSVYITFDRDVSEVSCTPYKDGQHQPAHAQRAVVEMMKLLAQRGCELVGFDVCGLPNTDGGTSVSGKTQTDAVELAFSDIKAFTEACQQSLG